MGSIVRRMIAKRRVGDQSIKRIPTGGVRSKENLHFVKGEKGVRIRFMIFNFFFLFILI